MSRSILRAMSLLPAFARSRETRATRTSRAVLHFLHTNIHAAAKNSCEGSRVNAKMYLLVLSRTNVATNLMNRAPRTQPTLAMGFAAQGIGSSRGSSRVMRITRFALLASAQAGVAATK